MDKSKIGDIIYDNKRKIMLDYTNDIKKIIENINNQNELILLYATVSKDDPYSDNENYTKSAFSALFKNTITLYSILESTLLGLYGPARVQFRNVYEYLLISKTVSIIEDYTLLEKWEQGKTVNIRRNIFEHVISPNSKEMEVFWGTLNKYTHGTLYSGQIALKYIDMKNEIAFNFEYIKMLLDMNYHVLNTCIANQSIQYNAKFWMNQYKKGLFAEKKAEIRSTLLAFRKQLAKEHRKVVLDFILKWTFR